MFSVSHTTGRAVGAIAFAIIFISSTARADFPHHQRQYLDPSYLSQRQTDDSGGGGGGSLPLEIINTCESTIWPAILTQSGDGPDNTGFSLDTGASQNLSVSSDWIGRVWGRTNCSFTSAGQPQSGNGQACQSGDCGGVLACKSAGATPVTLAEFTMNGSSSQTFYDISLVDGYNLPMAIVLLPNGVSSLEKIDQSTTNPSCIGSVGDLAPTPFNPYTGGQIFLGTSSSDPLPFETQQSSKDVADWCPWDLQVNAPESPNNGVYPYPDSDVERPAFDPCFSACAKYNKDQYCCTGSYDSSSSCSPNYYSKAAKVVCPDAYSYAYDDQTSTFINPTGGGYQVVFCPGGRSTNIIASKGTQSIQHGSGSSSGKGAMLEGGRAVAVWVCLVAVAAVMFVS